MLTGDYDIISYDHDEIISCNYDDDIISCDYEVDDYK